MTKRRRALTVKVRVQELGDTWLAYDATTPYGCQQRRREFDVAACAQAWLVYEAVFRKYDLMPPQVPRVIAAAVQKLREESLSERSG